MKPPIGRSILLTSLSAIVFLGVLLLTLPVQTSQRKLEDVLKLLGSAKDFKVRIAAASTLGDISNGTLAHFMLEKFKNELNPAVRLAILLGIAKIPDHLGLPAMYHAYETLPVSQVEHLTFQKYFYTFRKATFTEGWMDFFSSTTSPQNQASAVTVLGFSNKPQALPVIRKAVEFQNLNIKVKAITALGFAGDLLDLQTCKHLSQSENQTKIKLSAEICVSRLTGTLANNLSAQLNHRTVLNTQLKSLMPDSFLPQSYLDYQSTIGVQSDVEKKSRRLVATQPNDREDKSYVLMENEKLLPTLHLSANVLSNLESYSMDLEALRARIRRRTKELQTCYFDQKEKHPRLAGNLHILLSVGKSGHVEHVQFPVDTLKNTALLKCVEQEIRNTSFPAHSLKSIQLEYRLSFLEPQ